MREHCPTEASNISPIPRIVSFPYPEESEAKSKEGWGKAENTKIAEVILLHYRHGRSLVSPDLREAEFQTG